MYQTIKRLYETGALSADGVRNAAAKGWITEDQARGIIHGTSVEV